CTPDDRHAAGAARLGRPLPGVAPVAPGESWVMDGQSATNVSGGQAELAALSRRRPVPAPSVQLPDGCGIVAKVIIHYRHSQRQHVVMAQRSPATVAAGLGVAVPWVLAPAAPLPPSKWRIY